MTELENIVKNSTGRTREVLEQLVHSFADSIKKVNFLEQQIDYIKHDNRLLKREIYGRSSEKFKLNDALCQSELFDEFELCAQQVDLEEQPPIEEAPTPKPVPKGRPGRKRLPTHLPRKIIEHDLSDEEKQCGCGSEMECIGTQVSEELDYEPAKLTVIEHRCKKYGCAPCNTANKQDPGVKAQLKTAKKPNQLIPKSYATPSLLAGIATNKFNDGLPLYRLTSIFKRSSVDLSRQTMSTWMLKVGDAVIPLVNLLQDHILDYDISFADETTLQVLNETDRRSETKSYMWCFIGGPPDQRSIIYQYHRGRGKEIPIAFFEGYRGALHCDGYAGYAKLLNGAEITGINCMAHVRRKFFEALPNGKEKGVSGWVVRLIRELYKVEEGLKATLATPAQIKEARQKKSKPLLEKFKEYLDQKAATVPPKSKVGEAIKYTLKRWKYLIAYLEDGRYEIDNNRAERAIKPFVIGRKAWLFANSQAGAHSSARIYTLIESAKANGLEPYRYLEHIFKELPNCATTEDYEALLPWNVKARFSEFK
jgi:transposase